MWLNKLYNNSNNNNNVLLYETRRLLTLKLKVNLCDI
jgi:hypothetical protein